MECRNIEKPPLILKPPSPVPELPFLPAPNRGILVYDICLISISNSVSDLATNKSALNIERAY